jgi:hypothetical protein
MNEDAEAPHEDDQPGGNPPRRSERHKSASAPQNTQVAGAHEKQTIRLWLLWAISPIRRIVDWLDTHDGLLTAIATVAIAAFTYYLAHDSAQQARISGDQLDAMRGQLTEMKTARESGDKATAAQLSVMQTQATAMQRQVEAMQTASAQTERAIAATNRLAEEAAKTASESHRLAEEATKSVDAALVANKLTQQLAGAAAKGNDISQRALVGVQRAFMFARDVTLEKLTNYLATGDFTGTKPIGWIARVKWENSGATPTKGLVIDTYCLTSFGVVEHPWVVRHSTPLNKDQPGETKFLRGGQTHSVFGPHSTDTAGSGCPLAPIEVLLHQMSVYNVSMYGSAHYQDMLGGPEIHRTDFCFVVKITGNIEAGYTDVAGIPSLTSTAYQCAEHNCADAECEKEDKEDAARALAEARTNPK